MKVAFSRNVNDCVGTFSTGSLMGIIVALIFSSALLFAFLMLNSIQTPDRYDDPKKRHLIVHSKD